MQTVTISNVVGKFKIGEPITNRFSTVFSNVIITYGNIMTITDAMPRDFSQGDKIYGVISGASAEISTANEVDALDLFSVFGGKIPKNFSLSEYIQNIPVQIELNSITDLPDITSTDSEYAAPTIAYIPEIKTIPNPLQAGKESLERQDNRVIQNIANEPTYENNSKYPYNKVYQSESGHIKEIDDTPGFERLLDQHASGTYQEMHADGNMVTKVVNDKYTIIAGDGFVTVQGSATVNLMGDCQVRVGGGLTITADKGINMVSKGDFRLKAKSINMESTSGDISAKSAKNTNLTSANQLNVKSKSNHIDSSKGTSINTGRELAVESEKISYHSRSDMILAADAETYISSKADSNFTAAGDVYLQASGGANIKSGGTTAITSSSVEVDATLNVKSTTNMKAGGTDVLGYGASAAGSAATGTVQATVQAAESNGSGITYSADPDKILEMTDDDPEASAAAIKQGLQNGTIDPDELNAPMTEGEKDSSAPPNLGNAITTPTVKNVGSNPPDNLVLSPHFQLGKLSKHTPVCSHIVQAQHGLSTDQIVGNLQLLAQNCLEKIRDRFPDMQVTNAFRAAGNPNSKSGKISQHEKGQAADLQFASANMNRDLYFEYAKWIKANVIFDQLLLEYKTFGTKLPWIHVSFNAAGNRRQVLTMKNNTTYAQGLVNLT